MSAENWADTLSDDLSCDRCSHPYASHSLETGKCADAEVEQGGIVKPCWCRHFEPPYPDETSNAPTSRAEAEQP